MPKKPPETKPTLPLVLDERFNARATVLYNKQRALSDIQEALYRYSYPLQEEITNAWGEMWQDIGDTYNIDPWADEHPLTIRKTRHGQFVLEPASPKFPPIKTIKP